MRRGLAIINLLIFVVMFTIISAALLGMLSSSTRQIEADVRRIRGWYAAEAANVIVRDMVLRGEVPPAQVVVPWSVDNAGTPSSTTAVNVTIVAGGCTDGTDCVVTTSGFGSVW